MENTFYKKIGILPMFNLKVLNNRNKCNSSIIYPIKYFRDIDFDIILITQNKT